MKKTVSPTYNKHVVVTGPVESLAQAERGDSADRSGRPGVLSSLVSGAVVPGMAALAGTVCLLLSMALAPVATAADDEPIVIEDLSAPQLRAQIERIQTEFYRVYNLLNEDDKFDITCHTYKPTGSNISREACEPDFLIKRRGDNAKENQMGTDVLINQEALIQQLQPEFEILTEKMNAVAAESQYFRELNEILGMLRERLTELTN